MHEHNVDVLVLRKGTHGLPASEYADALRERLDGYDVVLARTPAEERALIPNASVVTSNDVRPELLERAENLGLFAGVAAGTGHLSLETFEEMGVTVTNASGIHAPNIAEEVLGHVLAFTRRLHEGQRRQNRREWRHYQARELKGSTVTVVGLGAIGQAIVDRLQGFDVDTIGMRYSPEKGGPTDEVVGFDEDEVHGALSRTEYLLLAAPLTDATRGLVGEAEFATLPPDAFLVNVGRGGLVETDALVAAIQGNEIAGAALDVTEPEPLPRDHELWGFENVHVTPHHAGHSPAHYTRLADIVAGNVRRLDEGDGDLENVVVSPDS